MCTRGQYGKQVMENGSPINMCTHGQYGKQVMENGSPIKHVHPFWHLFSIIWKTRGQYGKQVMENGSPIKHAHVYRAPAFHISYAKLC